MLLSAANTRDCELFEPLLMRNPAVRGHRHHPSGPAADPRSCRVKVLASPDAASRTGPNSDPPLGRRAHRFLALRFERLGLLEHVTWMQRVWFEERVGGTSRRELGLARSPTSRSGHADILREQVRAD